jgi:hypothetical protein
VAGQRRRLACTGGTDIVFVDPSGEVYPCNAWDLSMGNLHRESWDEIVNGARAAEVRVAVADCRRGCWMTGTAVPAMRRNPVEVARWVMLNKVRVTFGRPPKL